MYIAMGDAITLEDANNFREFHVVIDGDVAAAVAAFGGRATGSQRHNHLWIDIAFVRELADTAKLESGVDAEWEAQFRAMLDYAASKGWIDEAADRVEAHIQPPL